MGQILPIYAQQIFEHQGRRLEETKCFLKGFSTGLWYYQPIEQSEEGLLIL